MTPMPLSSQPAGPTARAARLARQVTVAVATCLGLAAPSWAQKPPNVTPGEMALLPAYCPDTQGFSYGDAYTNTSPRAAYWIALMDAKSFWALHHYCWALIKIRRTEVIGMPAVIREGHLRNALADYDYVIEHGSRDFILLPEIFSKRGELLLRMGNVGAALESFEASIRQKPDYWPPYARWAEFLVSQKRNKEAIAFLERGLTQAPDASPLRAAYKSLGGDPEAFVRKLPPRPKPQAPAADAANATADPAAAPALAASDAR